jgi:predicted RNA-binding Zn ribbon-like protein
VDFTHYNDKSVSVAVDLINTLGSTSGKEYLGTPELLRDFLRAHEIHAPESITEEDVAAVHAVRARLREVFEARIEDSARILNGLLDETGASPEMTNHDGHWHMHFVPTDSSIANRVSSCAAMGLATVIVEFGQDRLGICSADNCRDVFVDTSRNRSRRYCDDACCTRTNVAAHRARQKSGVA